ncbi:MAG TPA: lyase family protein, partial [Chitinophagaceae bacterium]
MELNNLTAISPVDGRYRKQVAHLDEYFSEYALMKYRVLIEARYFIFLAERKFFMLSAKAKQTLIIIAEKFSLQDAERIKEIETITNHDVKAVEYFLKQKLDENSISADKEWIHFGLTSQDINNTAIP